MPRDIITTVYKYNELDEKAKEKAREWFISCDYGEMDWEDLKEDAKNVFLILEGTHMNRMTGGFMNDAWHTINAILENHGPDCETFKTATKYKAELEALAWTEEADEAGWDEDAYNEKAEEFLNEILEDYRIISEKNAEYRISAEYIEEMMEINEYEFTKEGKIA